MNLVPHRRPGFVTRRVTISKLDALVGEKILFSLDEGETGRLYLGYAEDFGVEFSVPFVDSKAEISYPREGVFTPKVVLESGEERILSSVVVHKPTTLEENHGSRHSRVHRRGPQRGPDLYAGEHRVQRDAARDPRTTP